MRVRLVTAGDRDAWVAMRHALWPECPLAQHQQEVATLFGAGPLPMVAFVAEDGDRLLGFAEVSIRPWAEGCETDRVAYLEGWFVVDEARGRGLGRQLVATAEEWARAQGCTEFASDTDVDNELSAAAHRALGFVEVGVVRCFRKGL